MIHGYLSVPSRKRPRGSWKGQQSTWGDVGYPAVHEESDSDSETGDPLQSSKAKRRRCLPALRVELNSEDDHDSNGYAHTHSHAPGLDSASNARHGAQADGTPYDYEDWQDLKELFTKAVEQYGGDDTTDALPLLRGVIHECHRFLISYQDPSTLFLEYSPKQQNSSPDELLWDYERGKTVNQQESRECECPELPTAFHAILGTTLFLFGNLIAQDPALALSGEPNVPCPYWLAALDVFETGENLPSRTSGRCCNAREDWRMAIVWGRTLVCLANVIVTRCIKTKTAARDEHMHNHHADEPVWPPESPFSVIAARRPPSTRRMSLSWVSANDLMVLAIDQFSRGIFHMPHPPHHSDLISSDYVSRPKELFTIASDVLGVAERPRNGAERLDWALWADSVFGQMKMEADTDVWRVPITCARGRCWLIVGSERARGVETALENGDTSVLFSEAAQDARDALMTAASFFSRAKGSASSWIDPESQKLQPLMAEVWVTLANLTVDEAKRDELFLYAQTETRNKMDLDDGEEMDQSA